MKISKICAVLLALAMLLSFTAACGKPSAGKTQGTITFNSVTVVSALVPAETAQETVTGEESAPAPVRTEIYKGAVGVTPADPENITVEDVLKGYGEENGVTVAVKGNMITQIGDLSYSAETGYFWNVLVKGREAGPETVVTAGDDIQFIYMK